MTRVNQHARKPPVLVGDFTVLDAEWAAYIKRGALADDGAAYAKRWGVWITHRAEEGGDPWDAPASTFESLWLLRKEADGVLLSPDSVAGISVAVSRFYQNKGLTPANKRPENRGRWRDLRKSRRKTATQDGDPEASVVPTMRTDAQGLLAAPPPALRPVLRAALLLLLERFPPGVIDRLSTEDITTGARVEPESSWPVVTCPAIARGVCAACLGTASPVPCGTPCTHLGPAERFHTGLTNKIRRNKRPCQATTDAHPCRDDPDVGGCGLVDGLVPSTPPS
jgi:hypothetical protein